MKSPGEKSIFLPLVLISQLIAFAVSADEREAVKLAKRAYDFSNMEMHLNWVRSQIAQDVAGLVAECSESQNSIDRDALLRRFTQKDTLGRAFLNDLTKRVDPVHANAFYAWAGSAVGKRVKAAEQQQTVSEDNYEEQLKTYIASDDYTDARKQLIAELVDASGVVYFVSAMSTELSAVVSMASVCDPSAKHITSADKKINDDRKSEALYRAFMRSDLVAPTAFSYRSLSNDDIEQMLSFARSESGRNYHTALIQGVRAVLLSEVELLRLQLQQ